MLDGSLLTPSRCRSGQLNRICKGCFTVNENLFDKMCKTIKGVKLMRDYFKICSVIAVSCIAFSGCRTNDVDESAQLKGYISSISQTLRDESADMLVGSSMTTEEYQSKYSVVFADEKYISFRAEEYSYTGGAHGSNKITVGTIDRRTGRRMCLKDFVSSDKLPELTKILHTKVIKKLRGKENLQGEVLPIENFCVVKGGLKFVYNEYEVACYAAGAVEVVVSFAEIGK
jgi:hypothetical protein